MGHKLQYQFEWDKSSSHTKANLNYMNYLVWLFYIWGLSVRLYSAWNRTGIVVGMFKCLHRVKNSCYDKE